MAQKSFAPKPAAAWSAFADSQQKLVELISGADAGWADPAWRQELAHWRQGAAQALFTALQVRRSPDDLAAAENTLSDLAHCGGADFPASPTAVAEATALAARGWAGLAAAAFLLPSWQATFLPRLKDVPLWLLPYLATYYFAAPKTLTAVGQAEAYARVHLSALDSLVALAEANRGSAVVQALAERYRVVEVCPALDSAPDINREIRIKRGRLLSALTRAPAPTEPFSVDRTGRALRLGVVARAMADTPAALSLACLLERLSPTRFTTNLLVQEARQSAVERHLQNHGAAVTLLAGDAEQMAQSLRDASLDVAVFLLEGSWLGNPIAELALRRSAAVQIVHDGSGLPSGLSSVDLYTASPLAGSSPGERALLLGPAGFTGTGELPAGQIPEPWTRATIGMEDATFVFGVFADLRIVTPEFEMALASILAAAPGSRLVVVAPPTPGYRVDRFCTAFLRILGEQGVAPERVGVFADVTLDSHADRQACFGAIDALLDTTTHGSAAMACAAMAASRPVVAWPRAAHPAAAVLRQCGMEQLVALDAAGFVQTAARLCSDARWRRDLTARLAAEAPQQLLRYDSFTLSEAFGALVESACDGIRQSRRAFRAASAAVEPQASTPPAALREEAEMFIEVGSLDDAETRLRRLLLTGHEAVAARRRLADVLLRAGRPAEAADLLLSVVPLVPDDASAWLEIGLAARQAGRAQLALKAMQTSVQLEPKRVQSWRTLAELARENQNSDLLEQINVVLDELDAAAVEPALVASR